ncbi:UDP-glucose 4-epimerase GalE [Phaeobacter gallaeciensis]|uniref:UDP-glucose 4-epimerase GalE n=1 Tax=Phaeobacter gallaeciensis TaxID=60890 RepID=UPI00237FC8B7|nr:UDP-glucose 4-epimerase GalE [Phaeobacter gallaeciensis]MDE4305398.1 UDP-glucose 4-epimerase GalE [Phaeobacter gallaeciensis]MDE4309746.1 UDP-glucose 4-epimerase GalE [Phaeobacter gallaeciensis]MDE4313931.1 UDP-glucose 4-epimerase GalE [Phaeobacter gallaeciensis]MDE4318675.1 UDP-glucose 4-epimerase GalE [Phaeobacter gallaeciensis]MDE4322565.1 UDP-glucose 4-epimerase GalE [Phaeobacter gallaeciensis]
MTQASSILVTGGAGFIGSQSCKALKMAGYLPVVFDNLSTGHAEAVRFGPFVKGDIRDQDAVAAAISKHKITAILHFAASAYVGESVQHPNAYYDNNVGGMISLLKAASATGIKRIVFSSSCATYGVPETLPIVETTPQRPINPYGRTKLIGEQMLEDLAHVTDLTFACLRYFNAAGADPEGELGEQHDPETHLVPLALMAASGRREVLSIFGDDYPTPDGTCIRDYIHVADLARAHVLALQHLMQGKPSIKLNLGSGRGHSILEIVRAIEAKTGRKLPIRIEPRRAGDPPSLTADPSRAAEVLGFRAELSSLDQIIEDAAPWFGLKCNVAA